MTRPIKLAFLLITIAATAIMNSTSCISRAESKDKAAENTATVSVSAANFKENMRNLWADHILWTRNVIFCLVDGLPGQDNAAERLLKNEAEIGDLLKPYYGEEFSKHLTWLLYEHVNISAKVILASKLNDGQKLIEANNKWYENADEIAKYLSITNPNWPLDDMKRMMASHLHVTADEFTLRINKDYVGDITAFDRVRNDMLKMSDMLADGVIKQFPPRFGSELTIIADK